MIKVVFLMVGALILALQPSLRAQNTTEFEFQDITPNTFVLPDSPYLKDAAAVYMADVGSSKYITHSSGKFTVQIDRHLRIKIINNNGFDAATISIPLNRTNLGSEKITSLQAVTYNLVDGKILAIKLEEDQVYTDKKSKRFWLQKFTMPGLKVGSIVDVEYSIASDFTGNLPSWIFQRQYPSIWSEFKVSIPASYDITPIVQSRLPFYINKLDTTDFSYTDLINKGYHDHYKNRRWVMQHVPALKEEPFTSNINNHIARVFFLTKYGSWRQFWPAWVQPLNKYEFFGEDIYEKNKWLDDEIKTILAGCCAGDTLARARKIFAYLRDSITCLPDDGIFMSEPGLRKTIKNRRGNAADINLLLVAMLHHQHIPCSPVIISTKENGRSEEKFPDPELYNLTIAAALINKKVYYLDASDPALGFGKLNTNCYNGHARIIRGISLGIYLEPDSIKETTVSKLTVSVGQDGKWQAVLTKQLGYYESLDLRHSLKKKTAVEVVAELKAKEPAMEISDIELRNLDDKDGPATVVYTLNIEMNRQNDLGYLSPFPGEAFAKNPFKSAQRAYPVELPYKLEQVYDSEINIPEGYIVDGVPENLQILLNGGDGLFEYMITNKEKQLIVHTRLLLHKTTFAPEIYQSLREFFADAVHKYSEQIVLRKKSSL